MFALNTLINNIYFLFFIKIIFFSSKSIILLHVFKKIRKLKRLNYTTIYLFIILLCEIISEIAWLVFFANKLNYLQTYMVVILIGRFAWICDLIKFQSLTLFIESLSERKYKITTMQRICISLTAIIIFCFASINLFNFIYSDFKLDKYIINFSGFVGIYAFILLAFQIIYALFYRLHNTDDNHLPKILKKQTLLLLKFLILPYAFFQLLEIVQMTSSAHMYINAFISSPLLTFAIFYSLRKVMSLRFLNAEDAVDCAPYVQQIENFKRTLEALQHSHDFNDVERITQDYFKHEFKMPVHSVKLVVRHDKQEASSQELESFFGSIDQPHEEHVELVHRQGILVKDELAFTHFCKPSDHTQRMLAFMNRMNIDVFIPIIEQGVLVAYIMIDYNARAREFVVRDEQDQMIVFGSCLANVITLLRKNYLESVLQENNVLKEELFAQHQQINHYKESLRFFLRDTAQRKIGLMLYKNGQFSSLNPQAQELMECDPNTDAGHPVSIAIKAMIKRLERYTSAQSNIVSTPTGNKLVLNANFYGQKANIIVTITVPEVADLIKPYVDALKDPSEWDYLLYLQTTQSGRLINQLLPGSTEILMNTKVDLLKMALSAHALLLEVDEQDLMGLVEIIHHISLKERLVTLDLKDYPHAHQQAAVLFGMQASDKPLLEGLHTTGTLFINNIHLLALEHQDRLADCIQYGFYTALLGTHKTNALVRIICFSPVDLSSLVKKGTFSLRLFRQLRVSVLKLPCLSSLPQQELLSLLEGYSAQALADPSFSAAVRLSEHETDKLIANSPASIEQFKERVKNAIRSKVTKSPFADEMTINPGYEFADPLLAEAVRLGKTSLQDKNIMIYLWNKFHNQNKIASLLGVNRSSVNRRCKEFGLE